MKDAIILAHNYTRPEIQDMADFVGDSLELARKIGSFDEELIIFAGVDFMAEADAILYPEKKIVHPVPASRCPMAADITEIEVKKS